MKIEVKLNPDQMGLLEVVLTSQIEKCNKRIDLLMKRVKNLEAEKK